MTKKDEQNGFFFYLSVDLVIAEGPFFSFEMQQYSSDLIKYVCVYLRLLKHFFLPIQSFFFILLYVFLFVSTCSSYIPLSFSLYLHRGSEQVAALCAPWVARRRGAFALLVQAALRCVPPPSFFFFPASVVFST